MGNLVKFHISVSDHQPITPSPHHLQMTMYTIPISCNSLLSVPSVLCHRMPNSSLLKGFLKSHPHRSHYLLLTIFHISLSKLPPLLKPHSLHETL
ncbi:hypothetical protein CC80DRAFT_64686 [Byssothecium circinans]|uniref:Uncharacterized protein n=1 Tax=Byssothecium circinans TaxID=147558 RepID=A0A6A5TWD4_9PLEO|nr:hypothetical protein CC80DRAFT_64686 [Byssothecium circinans]